MKTFDKNITVDLQCPLCRESLMDNKNLINDKPSVKLNIELNEKRGTIRLCSIFGCYDHEVDIELKKDEIAKIHCPHCNQQLISDTECEDCNAPMIPFVLSMGGKVTICSRIGCEKHYIIFEDLNDALRKFYNTYED